MEEVKGFELSCRTTQESKEFDIFAGVIEIKSARRRQGCTRGHTKRVETPHMQTKTCRYHRGDIMEF